MMTSSVLSSHVEDLPEKSCWNGFKKCFQRNNYLEDVQTCYIFSRKKIVVTSLRLIWEAQNFSVTPRMWGNAESHERPQRRNIATSQVRNISVRTVNHARMDQVFRVCTAPVLQNTRRSVACRHSDGTDPHPRRGWGSVP